MGLVHIYCGDGKGKTTASVGLAVRRAGSGGKVVFCQFFKNGASSEISVLKSVPNITVLNCTRYYGRFVKMDEETRKEAREAYTELFKEALANSYDADLLVLDEAISSYTYEMFPRKELLDFIDGRPSQLEIVLTGRNPAPELIERADYLTEMCMRRHPFEKGIPARRGIEF